MSLSHRKRSQFGAQDSRAGITNIDIVMSTVQLIRKLVPSVVILVGHKCVIWLFWFFQVYVAPCTLFNHEFR